MTVVALEPSDGPVPPPPRVVSPVASASWICDGDRKWTWESKPPAVRILPSPEMTSVPGPITSAGSTPSAMSGLPLRPMPTIRPSRMPTSARTMPQWSSTIALVITVSSAPSAEVASDWFIDSRIDLPPPKTASSPPKVQVLLDLDPQVGVAEPDLVARGRAVDRRVVVAADRAI